MVWSKGLRLIMKIYGYDHNTYLYLNGIGVSKTLKLNENVELLPANCSPLPSDLIKVSKSEIDLGIATIFLRQVSSQFHITSSDSKTLAIIAWNSIWYGLLLSALFDCEAVCNFQCDRPAEQFSSECKLTVTNYHLRGLSDSVFFLDENDNEWINQYFYTAVRLLENQKFQNAVHCLATYRWHSVPRVRLALLWSGIEGLFDVDTEIVFRLSLYIAKFLEPNNTEEMKTVFSEVKKLYKYRSSAVHGSKMKGGVKEIITNSAQLLRNILRQCIIVGDLPDENKLVF